MPDHARSTDPAVQAQLDRLSALSPGADVLGLDRIKRLLARLGDPHRRLPPVFHVAGTNGKGSTCAFLRAGLEAAGYRIHVYTSPHLVAFNERIRLAETLIDDAMLAALLAEVLDHAEGIGASFFEITTAAAFLAFARTPADACVIEVGLGGRLDATSVLAPVACGIAQLGVDHQAFLGHDPAGIAREKAGIARAGVPLVTLAYPPPIAAAVFEIAATAGAEVIDDWRVAATNGQIRYTDRRGTLDLPRPALVGRHQALNLGLATAMLRHQRALAIPDTAYPAMAIGARWPARMQRLGAGPLTALRPASEIWLDGGHNPAAAEALAAALAAILARTGGRAHLIAGMLANKDPAGLLAPLAPLASGFTGVPVGDHDHHVPTSLAAIAHDLGMTADTAPDVASALGLLTDDPPVVLILGSLYLAGEALIANDERPA